MKDKIVVIGGGGHAKVVINVLKKLNEYDILGYTDLIDKGTVLGLKYLGNDNVLNDIIYQYKNCNAALGVGTVKVSDERKDIYERIKKIGLNFPPIVSNSAIISEGVEMGEGTVVLNKAFINACTQVGKCVIVNTNAIVEHDCRVGDFVSLAAGSILGGGATIGDNSFLGMGAMVTQYKNIGKNCLIGVGTVILRDVSDEGTYFGVPARKISITN